MASTRSLVRNDDQGAPTELPPTDPEVICGAILLGLAIFLAEGGYFGPIATTLFALLAASVALAFWLIRTGSFVLPVGLGFLLAILMIGSGSASVAMSVGRGGSQTDLVRDVAILLSYSTFLLAGYYFARDCGAVRLVWWVLIVVGVLRSAVQLWLFTGQVASGVSDVYVLRLEAGRGEQVQLVAVVAACLLVRGSRPGDFWAKVAKLSAAICVVSITLALSRVLLTELIIVAMIFSATRIVDGSGSLRLSLSRAFTVAAGGVAVLTLALISLRWVSEPAFTFVYEGFIEKLLNSWNEVVSTQQQSAQDIDENYRAFESDRGVQSFINAGWFSQWFGQGWGTSVKLGLDTASTRSEFVRTEAAFLHNGYISYLVKVGIIGLSCYVGFMLRLVHHAVFEPGQGEGGGRSVPQRQALLSVALCLGVASLTGGGFGFPSGFLSVALLIGTCLYAPLRPGSETWAPDPRTGPEVS